MKKVFLILLSALLLFGSFGNAFAGVVKEPVREVTSGTCGENLTWSFDAETGVLTISGTGEMYDYTYSNTAPWYELRTSITAAVIEEGVTSIGERAFRNCTALTSISIPSGITAIKGYTFDGCISLASIEFPESLTRIDSFAFIGCNSLTSIELPSAVTYIDEDAFLGCSALSFALFLGEPPAEFHSPAFYQCADLFCIYYTAAYANAWAPNGETMWNGYMICLQGMQPTEFGDVCGDNLTWRLNAETGALTVSGIGDMYDYSYDDRAPWFNYTSVITSVVVGEDVTSIGGCAFYDCTSLAGVVLPETLTTIGHDAFVNCCALSYIELPDRLSSIGDYAFYGTVLASIELPDRLSSIGDYAFRACAELTSIEFPEGMMSIGDFAFSECYELTSAVFMGEPPAEFGGSVFSRCSPDFCIYYNAAYESAWAPNGETTWNGYPIARYTAQTCGDDLYWGFNQATHTLTISGTGDMYDYADNVPGPWYDFASEIYSIVINEGVTSIGNDAFYECSALTSVSLPDSLETIGDFAFNQCPALESITIPKNVTSLDFPFQGCTSMTEINVDPESTVYASLNGVMFTKDMTELLIFPNGRDGEYVVPDGVTTIGPCAFYACQISKVVLPEGLTVIDNASFQHCRYLTSINIPQSVTTIGLVAFTYCSGLRGLRIPASVTSIGYGSFGYCYGLRRVLFEGEPIEDINTDLFQGFNSNFAIYYRPPFKESWSPNGETEYNGVPIIMCEPGDVDCNGVVDMSDISLLFNHLNGAGSLTEQGVINCDGNLDGWVNVMDSTAIFAAIANS